MAGALEDFGKRSGGSFVCHPNQDHRNPYVEVSTLNLFDALSEIAMLLLLVFLFKDAANYSAGYYSR